MRIRNRIIFVLNVFLDTKLEFPDDVKEVMLHADFAAKSSKHVEVIVCYVVDKKQEEKIRSNITALDIKLDFMVSLRQSQKYPMIGDILNRANEICDNDDYICYINSDIIIPYWFFDFLALSIRTHPENTGFIVNRKDIFNSAFSFDEDDGHLHIRYHPGFDCFIFPRHILTTSYFGRCTVGLPPIGALVANNMIANLDSVKLINDSVITLHRGDGQASDWQNKTKKIEENFELAYEGIDELVEHLKRKGVTHMKTLSFSKNIFIKYMISRGITLKFDEGRKKK